MNKHLKSNYKLERMNVGKNSPSKRRLRRQLKKKALREYLNDLKHKI